RPSIAISDQLLFSCAKRAKNLLGASGIHIGVQKINDSLSIKLNAKFDEERYRLKITKKGIVLEVGSPIAAEHGLQTLEQIQSQSPKKRFPFLKIDDWPDFKERAVYYDVCRGRVPKLEELFKLVEQLAHYKINQLQLYIEHTFAFRGHPNIGKGASPLSAEDILRLDEHCAQHGVELLPSLSTFGHLSTVIRPNKEYHHLAEDWGIGKYVVEDGWQRLGWTLSPANPEIYTFLDSLFAEFLPLFRSTRFNICCDETWDFGMGQSYEMCQKMGKGKAYLSHIIKLNDICKKYGKSIQFWGDIIRHYPELIKEIPTDVTVLDWGYNYDHNYAAISDFKKAGLPFYACPGTSGWVTLFNRIHEAAENIHGFAVAGKRNKAQGFLNTDWGDGGHFNFMEYSWHGYLFGAEQSWNVNADRQSFTKRFAKLFLSSEKASLANAINLLGDVTHLRVLPNYQSIWQHLFFAKAGDPIFQLQGKQEAFVCKNGKISRTKLALDTSVGKDALKKLEKIRAVFIEVSKTKGSDPQKVLPYWIFAVDTIMHAARKLVILGPKDDNTSAQRRGLAKEMSALQKRFEKLWMDRNRRSEIRVTLKRYRAAIQSLKK
ncbi:MAG: family 20 glycosylhydrolase, partial [Opitutaceae bacterium]|nr:family 20 glycosylhydrolase [Opitutaceae bacterium]